jgi:DNA-binding transcriptional ArsR family regulator
MPVPHWRIVRAAGKFALKSDFRVLNQPTDAQTATIAQTYRLLGDTTRLRILLACLPGPLPVNEIARRVDASQSLVSHHLRALRAARLVRGTRQNRQVLYQIDDDHIRHVLLDMIEHVMEPHEHASDSDDAAPKGPVA